jgi:GNAT superfamily N-acetyltransferase
MALWTWSQGDTLPALEALDDLEIDSATDAHDLASLTNLGVIDVRARLAAGNRCYVASIRGTSVAYGWAAAGDASIGELSISFGVAAQDRYLWDFKTLPQWRGLGIYPRLLQAILRQEGLEAVRFWIINAPENVASARGIDKAGFRVVGDLAFADDGRAALVAIDAAAARAGARLLGVEVIDAPATAVSPCWCCVMDSLRQGAVARCWPSDSLAGPACTCGTPGTPATS